MLEQKPPGAWYAVVLRRDFSAAKLFAIGAVGGSGPFPMPELGSQCVCCDAAGAGHVPFDPSTDRMRCQPVQVPICEPCRWHVKRDTNDAQLGAMALCVASGAALLGVMKELWVVAGLGAAGVAGCVAVLMRGRAKARELAESGHFAGLEIMAHPGQCSVRTMNRRVAMELAQRHAEVIHRVR